MDKLNRTKVLRLWLSQRSVLVITGKPTPHQYTHEHIVS